MVQTPIVTMNMAKAYLRVDTSDEDALIGILLKSAEQMVMDVARLSSSEWETIQKVTTDDDSNVLTIHTRKLKPAEIIQMRELLRIAILYAVGYLYEHREEANHHDLMLTLRNLLFAIREGVL
ncbi:MAG: phage gp6-like head-tail connector protein [Clostridia bacterium]|nr:phage gp6-like head-tail connector protein [Clostridia bacterium]MBQ9741649.1 phage gp6-like head-tail connector protein [Kiritimatiellia bacterium]